MQRSIRCEVGLTILDLVVCSNRIPLREPPRKPLTSPNILAHSPNLTPSPNCQKDPRRRGLSHAVLLHGAEHESFEHNEADFRAIQMAIGRELRVIYDLPRELPHRILKLLMQLDARQDGEPSSISGSGQNESS